MKEWVWVGVIIYVVFVVLMLIANKRFWDAVRRTEKYEQETFGEYNNEIS